MIDCNSDFTSTCRSTERAKAKGRGKDKDKVTDMVTVKERNMGRKEVSNKKEKSVELLA